MTSAEENPDKSDKDEEHGDIQLEMVQMTLGTLDLRESEIYPSRHKRRRRRKKEEAKLQNEGRSATQAGIRTYFRNSRNSYSSHKSSARFIKFHLCLLEFSNTDAGNQGEEVQQAMPAEDTPQETQSKSKRKKKAQNKEQLEGE